MCKSFKAVSKAGIQKNGTDGLIFRAETETQMWRADLWTQQGKEMGGPTERGRLTYIHYRCKVDSQWEAAVIAQGTQLGALW